MTKKEIEQLFRSNYPAMLTLACRMLHDSEAARDIVHERFASILTDCPASVTPAYLLHGVRLACLSHIRNVSLRQRLNLLYALELNETEDEEWPDEQEIALLNALIDEQLSPRARQVLKMRFNQRMSYKEIAETLEISEAAVYKNLRHALDVLRKKFNEK